MDKKTAIKIIRFIGEKNPDYVIDNVKERMSFYPLNDESKIDDNGLQGFWVHRNKEDMDYEFEDDEYENDRDDYTYIGKYHNDKLIYAERRVNGHLQDSGLYRNRKTGEFDIMTGKRHGYWKFYDMGELREEGNFVNDERQGEWINYHKGANEIKEVANYKNGYKHGNYKALYIDGSIEIEGTYDMGEKTGQWTAYYKNGNKSTIGNFENGKKMGKWEAFYENKELKVSQTIKNTHKHLGTIDFSWNTRASDTNVGEYKEYYPDGKPKASKNFNNSGNLDGESIEYYPDGRIAKKGNYDNGTPVGVFLEYAEDGQSFREMLYDGKRVSRERKKDKDGNIISDFIWSSDSGVGAYHVVNVSDVKKDPRRYGSISKFPDEN